MKKPEVESLGNTAKMGETASRLTAPTPLNPRKLTQRQLAQLLSHFGLNELSPAKARVSLLAFARAFPPVLQHLALLLFPALKDVAMQEHMPQPSRLFSLVRLNSVSLFGNSRGKSSTRDGGCKKESKKKQAENLRTANSISLQEIVDAVSCCCSGEALGADQVFAATLLRNFCRVFEPSTLLLPENAHVRKALEMVGGVSLEPRTASTLVRSNSGSSSGSKCAVTFVSMGCSSRACVALMQILQFGYLETVYMINSSSVLFQEEVGRTSSALSCGNLQEGQRRGSASRGGRAITTTWDSAPDLNLHFPSELDFTFAVRGMASAFAEAVASASSRAAHGRGAAAGATAADSAANSGPQAAKPGEEGNRAESAAKPPTVAFQPAFGNVGNGTVAGDVESVFSWIKAVLPALPALCTLGVATHLLGDALSEGEPQMERNDSSAVDVRYSVYARRRNDTRSRIGAVSRRESAPCRARGDGGGSLPSPFRSAQWTRTASAEERAVETKGWHGDGPLDSISKCFTDEHAFVLRLTSTMFPFPPKVPWTCLYASWKHGSSMSRLSARCFFYGAPMVLVVRLAEGQVLGAMIPNELKEGGHIFFGDPNIRLFTLEPQLKVISATGLGSNYMYLNTKNKFYPVGIGFGGQASACRLFVGDEMKNCYVTRSDCTFGSGLLLSPMHEPIPQDPAHYNEITPDFAAYKNACSSFSSAEGGGRPPTDYLIPIDVKEMEIWGTGDAKALERQVLLMKQQEQLRQERLQVDRGRLLESNFDREFLLGNVLTHARGPEAPAV